MNFVLIFASMVGFCQAATFNNADGTCSYPTWECDCKLVYDCDGDGKFPVDVEDDPAVAGCFKDLTPDEYPLRIPGKRWRRNAYNQEEYCEQECGHRMGAFLGLEGYYKTPTDYTYSALCIQLLAVAGTAPFLEDGSPEPCCTIYLEYGRKWCTEKRNYDVGTVRCLSRGVDPSFNTEAFHHVFGAEGGCTADGSTDFTWCTLPPTCIMLS